MPVVMELVFDPQCKTRVYDMDSAPKAIRDKCAIAIPSPHPHFRQIVEHATPENKVIHPTRSMQTLRPVFKDINPLTSKQKISGDVNIIYSSTSIIPKRQISVRVHQDSGTRLAFDFLDHITKRDERSFEHNDIRTTKNRAPILQRPVLNFNRRAQTRLQGSEYSKRHLHHLYHK